MSGSVCVFLEGRAFSLVDFDLFSGHHGRHDFPQTVSRHFLIILFFSFMLLHGLVPLLLSALGTQSPVASLPVTPWEKEGGVECPLSGSNKGQKSNQEREMGCHPHLRDELADPRRLVRPVREQRAVLLGTELPSTQAQYTLPNL